MKKLSITVVHRLPNRVRIKLSLPMKEPKNFYKTIKNNLSMLNFKYSPRNQCLTLEFEPSEILLQEIIYRVGIAFSIENGLVQVRLLEGYEYKSISPIAIYAFAAITAAGFNKFINIDNTKLQNSMNTFAMGITVGSVLEHAYSEVRRRGMFDIEILPALYLLKSFIEESKLSTVLIMWLTTFGRHLTVPKQTTKILKVFRTKTSHSYQYTATILDDHSIENFSDMVNHIFFKKANTYMSFNERYITLSKI
ncbi:MAG: hypothetical protein Q4A58_04240 [Fusobacterium sp.]|uniref:hypothetical protein n=1 Tax=Fusobacterium sp. TaxID=68766 RepID=UPI0026DC1C95|nr:hypothetical protein [Fusobacterium sp.]MDO4690485.1 hypothetical protein [Fusobacterium sp.]